MISCNDNNGDETVEIDITTDRGVYYQERTILLNSGINLLYTYVNNVAYTKITLNNIPFVYGKAVYIVVNGTNIMYIFPYELLKSYQWFNNALGTSGFHSNKISLPTGNILLPIDCTLPLKFDLIYNKILKGSSTAYIAEDIKDRVRDMFDYFGIDM